MKTTTTSATALASAANVHALVKEAFDAVGASFERFCLMAGIESLTQMLGEDVDTLAGGRYEHRPDKPGYQWGQAKAQVGFHGGKIEVDRPRVRNKATGNAKLPLPTSRARRPPSHSCAGSSELRSTERRRRTGKRRLDWSANAPSIQSGDELEWELSSARCSTQSGERTPALRSPTWCSFAPIREHPEMGRVNFSLLDSQTSPFSIRRTCAPSIRNFGPILRISQLTRSTTIPAGRTSIPSSTATMSQMRTTGNVPVCVETRLSGAA